MSNLIKPVNLSIKAPAATIGDDDDCVVVQMVYKKKMKNCDKWKRPELGKCARTTSRWESIKWGTFKGSKAKLVPKHKKLVPKHIIAKVPAKDKQVDETTATEVVRPLRDHPVAIPLERLDGYADYVDLTFVTDMSGPTEPAELPAPIQELFDNLRAAYGIEKEKPTE